MRHFVWTKMQAEGGLRPKSIIDLKEAERQAGVGTFWWGIGNSLGAAAEKFAKEEGGTLPVLFSMMRTAPQKKDMEPKAIYLWTWWEDWSGKIHAVPPHVLEWSGRMTKQETRYALVCQSSDPLVAIHKPFNPSKCVTHLGKAPADSQVTALLFGDMDYDHSFGSYEFGFRASLVKPWFVKLVRPREFPSETVRAWMDAWENGGEWKAFVDGIRGA